jgi:serine/threonine protein kinase
MLGHLLVVAGPDQGQSFSLQEGITLTLGRGQQTDSKFKDPQVSRKHCEVRVQNGKVLIVDAGSSSGTLVGDKKITEHALHPGETFRIGSTEIRYVSGEGIEATTMVPAAAPSGPTPEKVGQLQDLVGSAVGYFQVEAVIAKGQSGLVFKATDTKEDRQVAFKVLWPEFSKNEDDMQRFVRAMKTMLPLRHPNLVSIYGAGKTGNYCWISMEHVQGENLAQVIQRIGTAGMLDWKYAYRVAVHIARALEFAQKHHIIHRNLTPQNILFRSEDKTALLGDLMLAKALEGNLANDITRPGELLGDVRYLSPERTRRDADVDGRSDIYSLGAMVYALLTGRPPCEGGSLPETIQKIRQEVPVKPKKFQLAIPELFEGLVMKMLEKQPADRFQTPGELLAELERIGKYQGITV